MDYHSLSSVALATLKSAAPELWDQRKFVHASLVVQKNRVVAVGINRMRTHPLAKKIGYRFDNPHSELDAFLRLPDRNAKGLQLFNYRFNKQGQLRNSRPCKICMSWCCHLFDEIIYSSNGEIHHV